MATRIEIETSSCGDNEITSTLFDQQITDYNNVIEEHLENTALEYNEDFKLDDDILNIDLLGNSFSSLNVLVVDDSIIQRKIIQSKFAGNKGGQLL